MNRRRAQVACGSEHVLQEFVVARLVLVHGESVNILAFGDDYFGGGSGEADGVGRTEPRFGVNGFVNDYLAFGKEPLRFGAGGSSPAAVVPVGAFHRFDSPVVAGRSCSGLLLSRYPGRPVDFIPTSRPQRLLPAFFCRLRGNPCLQRRYRGTDSYVKCGVVCTGVLFGAQLRVPGWRCRQKYFTCAGRPNRSY